MHDPLPKGFMKGGYFKWPNVPVTRVCPCGVEFTTYTHTQRYHNEECHKERTREGVKRLKRAWYRRKVSAGK